MPFTAPEHDALRDRAAARWTEMFVLTRAAATALAVLLLLAHDLAHHDRGLAAVTLAYGVLTIVLAVRSRAVRESPLAWAADGAATLGLVLATGDWRTPCYLLFVTSLVLPATLSSRRTAFIAGVLATCGYGLVAVVTGIDITELRYTTRLESFVTHLTMPPLVTFALAYAASLMRRLRDEHLRAERLAIEAERQRIGWELHDSAKQRVHVAHLLLSSRAGRIPEEDLREIVEQAMAELRRAELDMQASVEDLSTAGLDGRRLVSALREHAEQLRPIARASLAVGGRVEDVPPQIALHAYRIAGEAMTNAVRHARARHIVTMVDQSDEELMVTVSDDGAGMPAEPRPGANGLRSMRSRAETIGASLTIAPADDEGPGGTTVRLVVPTPHLKEDR